MIEFKPKILKNDQEYDQAMDKLSKLMDIMPVEGSTEFDELELLSILIENYESKYYPVDKPTAIAAIKFRMDQDNLTPKDMEKYLGSRSKVSEILNGERNLSLTMITKIHKGLGIPLDILIQTTDNLSYSHT